MPTFSNQQVNPPEDWQEFEKLCRDLWARIWGDPNTQLNGRSGQKQHGVDVFGRIGGDGDLQGIQCKGKDSRYGEPLTEGELKAEVEKAKKFEPPIKGFILTTTTPNDASIQEAARKLTEEQEANGLFPVTVLGWDEIVSRLGEYSELVDKYYPDQGPKYHRIQQQLESIESRILGDASQAQLSTNIAQEVLEKIRADISLSSLPDGEIDPEDKALNQEIDSYRDRIDSTPSTALSFLQGLKDRSWDKASKQTRFRILTNIGSAFLALGNASEAAKNFVRANKFASDEDAKALKNLAYSYLIQDDHEKARKTAERAITLDPDDGDGYAILVAASNITHVNVPEDLVPEAHQTKTNVIYTIGHAYRRREQPEKALEWFKRAYEAQPDSKDYRASYGCALLGRVIEKSGVIFPDYFSEDDFQDLDDAIKILDSLWRDITGTEFSESYAWIGVNLCTALSARNRNDELELLIPKVVELLPDAPELRKLAAIFDLNRNDPDSALEHLSHIPDGLDSECDLLRAEVLAEASRFNEALDAVDVVQIPSGKDVQRSAARGLRVRLIAKVHGPETGLEAARKVEEEHPNDPLIIVSVAQLYAGLNDRSAAMAAAQRARRALRTDSKPAERFAVANVLYDLGSFADALEIFQSLLRSYHDSQLLRRLLICQYETDQRKNALDTLASLPITTRKMPFFRRYLTAIYFRTGEYKKAKEEAEAYLSDVSDDLEMRLNWIGLSQRLGDDAAIREFLRNAPDFSDASPEHQMHLAHLYCHYGDPSRGLRLAYELRREYQDEPSVHLGYVGLLLGDQIPNQKFQVSTVADETAFLLEDKRSRQKWFIVDSHSSDKRFPEEISLEHPIAQEALGKSVGDKLEVGTNPYQADERNIVEIKSKFVFVLHKTMGEFSANFPTTGNFWSIDVGAKEGDGFDFSPIFKALDEQQSHVLEVRALYKDGTRPISFIAKLLGAHPLAVWTGFLQNDDDQIICCDGAQDERETALLLVENNKNGFVIEPLTLFSMVTLDVYEELTNTFGRFGITQSCLDLYSAFLLEMRTNPPKKSMAKIGDHYTLQELTDAEIAKDLEKFEKAFQWAKKSCDVYPAVGAHDIGPEWVNVSEYVDRAFTDMVLAASSQQKLILCDDKAMRSLAKEMMDVDGVWLQILLMKAVERKTLSEERYCDVVAQLVEAGVHFTTINSRVLFWAAEQAVWAVTDRFRCLASSIGGRQADIVSSVRVAAEFLITLWNSKAPLDARRKMTTLLIDELTNNVVTRRPAILRALMTVSKKINKKKRNAYIKTLKNWCTDRSITLLIFESENVRRLKQFLRYTTSLTRWMYVV